MSFQFSGPLDLPSTRSWKHGFLVAIEVTFIEAAKSLKTFLVEDDNAETEEPGRGMVRERAVQSFRPARDQVRAQPSA